MKKFIHLITSITLLISVLISLSPPVFAKEKVSFGRTISVGFSHTLAIKSDGSLWAWGGSNLYGEIGDGTDNMKELGSGFIVTIEEIKRLSALFPKKILENVREVSAGNNYSMAIKNDGSLWAWGYNFNGILGNGKSSDFVNHENNSNIPVKIMDHVATVSCGPSHVLAVKKDGSLWAWGSNDRGQLGDGTNIDSRVPNKIMENVVIVSSGHNFSMAIKEDGSLWSWGCNDVGILGNGKETFFEGINNDSNKPLKIMDNVSAVSAGEEHTMAVKTDGSLWTWGLNRDGKLGNGKKDGYVKTPIKIMDGVKSAQASLYNSLVIKEDSSLWTWGSNYNGELGNGTNKDSHMPEKIMEDVEAISSYVIGSHFMAIKKDRSLWGWGNDRVGQLGNGGYDNYSTIPVKVLDDMAFTDMNNTLLTESGTYHQPSPWFIEEIESVRAIWMKNSRLFSSYQNNITREEFAEITVTLYEALSGHKVPLPDTNPFTDTDLEHVLKANSLNIVSGNGKGIFNPNGMLSRQDMAKMYSNLLTALEINPVLTSEYVYFKDEDQISHYAKASIQQMYKLGIILGNGNGLISPLQNSSREQAIAISNRIYKKFK